MTRAGKPRIWLSLSLARSNQNPLRSKQQVYWPCAAGAGWKARGDGGRHTGEKCGGPVNRLTEWGGSTFLRPRINP